MGCRYLSLAYREFFRLWESQWNQQGRMCGVRRGPGWTPRATKGAGDESPAKKEIIKRRKKRNSVVGRNNFRRKAGDYAKCCQ